MDHSMQRIALLTLLLSTSACATHSLDVAVRRTLGNTYAARRPADSRPSLGTRIGDDKVPKVNDCYEGTLRSPSPSWEAVTVSYRRASQEEVTAELGDMIGLSGAVEASVSGKVSLSDTMLFELDDLYFLPTSGCATGAMRQQYKSTRRDRVIVRAVMAQELDVRTATSSKVKLSPKVKLVPQQLDVGGKVTNARELDEALKGDRLFYAEQVVTVETTLLETQEIIQPGKSTKKLEICRFFLEGFGDTDSGLREWHGALTCDDGSKRDMSGVIGRDTTTVTPGEGVTWAVYIEDHELGSVRVDFTRWVVMA
jgi:hypothetical protein